MKFDEDDGMQPEYDLRYVEQRTTVETEGTASSATGAT